MFTTDCKSLWVCRPLYVYIYIVDAALQGIRPGALVVPNFGPRWFRSRTIFMPSPTLRQGSIHGAGSKARVLDMIKQF